MRHALQTLQRFPLFVFLLLLPLTPGLAFGQTTPATRSKPTTATGNENCTSADCHAAILAHKVVHGPVAQKKCLDCHKVDDAAQHTFKKLAPPNQGCGQCHDLKLQNLQHAPVRDGKCTDCHDPHGSEFTNMLVADSNRGICVKCHKMDEVSARKYQHTPFAGSACSICHDPHSAAQPKLLRQTAYNLCVSCHKQVVPKPGEAFSMHAPVKENCIGCHDPHASNNKNELKQALPDLCLSCHKNVREVLATAKVKHFDMTKDASCEDCHVAHFSKLSKLQKQTQPAECLACHDKEIKTADGRTITNMAALLRDNPEQHGPIRLGACTACHQPHGGQNDRMLIAAYPPDFYAPYKEDTYKLCFTCHSQDIVLKKEDAPTGFADGRKNLHAVHVNQEKGRTCRACHEVHASKEPFHIRDTVPFGPSGWLMSINFKQTATGGSCSPGCHAEKTYDHGNRPRSIPVVALTPRAQDLINSTQPAATRMATALAAQGKGNFPVPLPPFTPGIYPCSTCHDPNQAVNTQRRELHKPHENIQLKHDEEHRWCLDCHNAQNRDVLRSAAGDPIPFSESYRLCGQCHGLQYRDWQNGVHGKRTGDWDGPKQYLLCVNCHDPHSPKFKPLEPLPPPVRPGQTQ